MALKELIWGIMNIEERIFGINIADIIDNRIKFKFATIKRTCEKGERFMIERIGEGEEEGLRM